MDTIKRTVVDALGADRASSPTGSIRVVDPSPLNWLYINYNCVEELVRVSPAGHIEPAAMAGYAWIDNQTLEVKVRDGERFQDGEAVTAASVKRAFDELMRWSAPHPPGTQFNHPPGSTCEIVADDTVRFHYAEPDGGAVGKLRAMHVMSTRFWNEVGFGYARFGTGDGHW